MYDQSETNLAKIVAEIRLNLKETNHHVEHQHYYNNVIGAGGLIYDTINDKILVVKGMEKWSLPKGHKDNGEEPYETAMREIFEETSIKVELTPKCRSKRILKCIYYFIIIENGEQLPLRPIDTNEVNCIQWCTKQQLMSFDCNKQLRYFVKKWDLMLNIFHKYHDKLKYNVVVISAHPLEEPSHLFSVSLSIDMNR